LLAQSPVFCGETVIFRATVIVAIYKDLEALKSVLWGLSRQTEKNFEVVVTEDCQESATAQYLQGQTFKEFALVHLNQEDIGFRKTRAVNRAIAIARSEYLIFLDGDCIPHPQFVHMHLQHAEESRVLAGRRMHLGERISEVVRKDNRLVGRFFSWSGLWSSFYALHRDGVRNFEIGAPSQILHKLRKRHHLSIIGCNFSCAKSDMLKINGYDEELRGVGGEDGDLEWRFNYIGVSTKNVKHLAIVYHLWHDGRRTGVDENTAITEANQIAGRYRSVQGIANHLKE
jgi:glycosyltransferase involved in cell wall biosynthesis